MCSVSSLYIEFALSIVPRASVRLWSVETRPTFACTVAKFYGFIGLRLEIRLYIRVNFTDEVGGEVRAATVVVFGCVHARPLSGHDLHAQIEIQIFLYLYIHMTEVGGGNRGHAPAQYYTTVQSLSHVSGEGRVH